MGTPSKARLLLPLMITFGSIYGWSAQGPATNKVGADSTLLAPIECASEDVSDPVEQMQAVAAFKTCYGRSKMLVLRSKEVADHLQDVEKQYLSPRDPLDVHRPRFTLESINSRHSFTIRSILASACLEKFPLAKKCYRHKPFRGILREAFEGDHTLKQSGIVNPVLELVLLNTLLTQDSELSRALGPMFMDELRLFIASKLPLLNLRMDEQAMYRSILSREVREFRIFMPHPFIKFTGAVTGEHDLNIHFGRIGIGDFISIAVHESCHLNSKAAEIRKLSPRNFTDAQWVYFTIREEFRASFLTRVFQEAWIQAFPNYSHYFTSDDLGPFQLDKRTFFSEFTSPLTFNSDIEAQEKAATDAQQKAVLMAQKKAVNQFLVEYMMSRPDEQEDLLTSWLNWD